MPDTGALYPTSVTNWAGTGGPDWSNPSNALTDNGAYARIGLITNQTSDYLLFNFTPSPLIPTGATITGLIVQIEMWQSENEGAPVTFDSQVKAVKAGVVGTTNKATFTALPTAPSVKTYGAFNDTWGLTWTAAEINGGTSGFVIALTKPFNKYLSDGYIDYGTAQWFYSGGEAGESGKVSASLSLAGVFAAHRAARQFRSSRTMPQFLRGPIAGAAEPGPERPARGIWQPTGNQTSNHILYRQ